jgi:hypothetical protein
MRGRQGGLRAECDRAGKEFRFGVRSHWRQRESHTYDRRAARLSLLFAQAGKEDICKKSGLTSSLSPEQPDNCVWRTNQLARLRKAADKLNDPDAYPLDTCLTKVSAKADYGPVRELMSFPRSRAMAHRCGPTQRRTWDGLPVALAFARRCAADVAMIRWFAVGLWWNATRFPTNSSTGQFFGREPERRLSSIYRWCSASRNRYGERVTWRIIWRSRAGANGMILNRPCWTLEQLSRQGTPGSCPGLLADCLPAWLVLDSGSVPAVAIASTCEARSVTTASYTTCCCSTTGITRSITHGRRRVEELPGHRVSHSNASRWPAVLRWLEVVNLVR